MAKSDPIILSGILTGLDDFLLTSGVRLADLLAEVDLAPELLEEPTNELPLNAVAELFEHAAARTSEPLFGLHFAKAFKHGGTGVVGYLVAHSPTLGDAIAGLIRYTRLLVSPIDMKLIEEDGFGCLNWTYPAGFAKPWKQYSLFTTTLVILRMKLAAGANWQPSKVEFEHRFEGLGEHARLMGGGLEFNRSRSAICFASDILDNAMPGADDTLYHIVRQLGDRQLEENPQRNDIVALTRQKIVATLSEGAPLDLERIAKLLDLTPRTLQQRLSKADTNFSDLLDATRRELADSYLRDTDALMTEIAFMLGFSELSVFTRVAVRWFGMSPRAYRQSLRSSKEIKPRDAEK